MPVVPVSTGWEMYCLYDCIHKLNTVRERIADAVRGGVPLPSTGYAYKLTRIYERNITYYLRILYNEDAC